MKRVLFLLVVLNFIIVNTEAQNFSSYPIIVRPLDKTINTASNDYASYLTSDRKIMYFTSYRSDSSLGEADIFYAHRMGDGWSQAMNAGSTFNTIENDGSLSIASDSKTVVFAADNRSDGFGDTDLYLAELVNGVLTNIKNLGSTVNSSWWDSQPTISGDGKTIYFASSRPGEIGGTDIWMTSMKSDGNWSEAVRLSRMINTRKEERSPYITPDGGTLFFSSDGWSGYGMKDIFMSTFENGEWSQPVNLGPIINSDKDEIFFYAPLRDQQFYLSSSRGGGFGGLDIYEGTPNIFGAGMFRLTLSVLDSISRKSLPSIVNIVDLEQGNTLLSIVTNSQAADYSQLLPANRSYRIEAQIRDYPSRAVEIRETPPNTEKKVVLLFGPITVAEFDLGKYNVPFFVTGYYRPNTGSNLDSLYSLMDGPLGNANYIERFKKGSKRYDQYRTYAQTVEGIFQTVYTAAVDEIFPRFKMQGLPNEALLITVTGYADPQPIIGKYIESETVRFQVVPSGEDLKDQEQKVSSGDEMDNLKLSGLRAWHSGLYLDKLFTDAAAQGHSEYVELKNAGKIKYKYVGGDVNNDNSNYAVQRRIHISIKRVGEGVEARGEEVEFDLNKRFKN